MDGTILFAFIGSRGVLRVSADGVVPEPVTMSDIDEPGHSHPVWLPGDQAFLYTTWTESPGDADNAQVAVYSLATEEGRVLTSGARPRYTSTGHIVFARGEGLWAASFDPTQLALTGEARPIVDQLEIGPFGTASYDVSADGSLVYLPPLQNAGTAELVWVDRTGRSTPLLEGLDFYAFPRVSPDGGRLAVGIGEADAFTGVSDVWVYEIERGARTRLTFDGSAGSRFFPVWTPDGRRITLNGSQSLRWTPASGAGQPEPLFEWDDAVARFPFSWSPDGQTLAFYEWPAETGRDIWMLPIESLTPQPFIVTPFEERAPSFSPDGRWLAYVSDETGEAEVFMTPYPDADPKIPISTAGGTEPVWSRDGRELFYRTDDALMAVPIDLDSGGVGTATELFADGHVRDESAGAVSANYDVAPDRRFVMIDRIEAPTTLQTIHLVLNWFDELQRLVPTP